MAYEHKGFFSKETEEKFKKITEYEYNKLLKNDELIFETTMGSYNIDTNKLFEEFFYDKKNGYGKLLSVPDEHKTQFIKNYLFEHTIIPAFEQFEKGLTLKKFQSLEENEQFDLDFSSSIKYENTAKYLIENFIFNDFPKETRIEMTEAIVFSTKLQLEESLDSFQNGYKNLGSAYDKVENAISNFFVGTTVGLARSIKEMLLFGVVALYSPYQLIGSSNVKYKMLGRSGTSRAGKALELISPTRNIAEMLLKPSAKIGEILKVTNELDNADIKDFLKDIQEKENTRESIINDCWTKNARVIDSTERQGFQFSFNAFANWIKTQRMQYIGNPQDTGAGMLGFLFGIDANDQSFQKSFFEYRKCVYDHVFGLILGYAKVAMSQDITSNDILEKVKVASRRNDYNIFNNIKTDGTDIKDLMYKVGKVLLSVDEIAEKLKENKQELYQDKYLDQFYMYLKQKIKQAYLDLDEAAEKQRAKIDDNKLKDSIAKGEQPKYEESWKDHKLKNVREYEKGNTSRKKIKSIYD
jgi:hypothetical protein